MSRERDVSNEVLVTPEALNRWRSVAGLIATQMVGKFFRPDEVGEEDIFLRDGDLVVSIQAGRFRFEMRLDRKEWSWRDGN